MVQGTGVSRIFLVLSAAAVLASCSSPRPLDPVVIGTRRGDQNAVDPTTEVEAGSRKHLAASTETRAPRGWVVAAWTIWPKGQMPRVVHTKMFNTVGPTTLFVHLDSSTVRDGWEEGTITCDFKDGSGAAVAASIRVVPKRL